MAEEDLKELVEELMETVGEKDITIQKASEVIETLKGDLESVMRECKQLQSEKEERQRVVGLYEKENSKILRELNQSSDHQKKYEEKMRKLHRIIESTERKLKESEERHLEEVEAKEAELEELRRELSLEREAMSNLQEQYKVKESGFRNAFELVEEQEGQLARLKREKEKGEQERRKQEAIWQQEISRTKRVAENLLKQGGCGSGGGSQVHVATIDMLPIVKEDILQQLTREQDLLEFLTLQSQNQVHFVNAHTQAQNARVEGLQMKCSELETRLLDASIKAANLSTLLADYDYAYKQLRNNYDRTVSLIIAFVENYHPALEFEVDEEVDLSQLNSVFTRILSEHAAAKLRSQGLQQEVGQLRQYISSMEMRYKKLQEEKDNAIHTLEEQLEIREMEESLQMQGRNQNQNMNTNMKNDESLFLLEKTIDDLESLQSQKEVLLNENTQLKECVEGMRKGLEYYGQFLVEQMNDKLRSMPRIQYCNVPFIKVLRQYHEVVVSLPRSQDASLQELRLIYEKQEEQRVILMKLVNEVAVRILEAQDEKDKQFVKCKRKMDTCYVVTHWKRQVISVAELLYEISIAMRDFRNDNLADKIHSTIHIIEQF